MENKISKIIVEEKSQEISENEMSITKRINNEILKTEENINKKQYNPDSTYKTNKIKLKIRATSLKLNSQKKIPPKRKTTFKENKKSMFSNERKSRNTNQMTTSSSTEHNTNDLNLLKKTEEISLPKINLNNNLNEYDKFNLNTFELSPKKSLRKISTLKITSKNKVTFQNELESPPNLKDKNNLLISQNTNPMKRLLKKKTFNSRHHKKKYLFLNTKKNYEITPFNKDLAFLKYPIVKTSQHSINSFIKSFAVNSYNGLIRNYNEDKVSIILTVNCPKNFKGKYWPKISFIAIYDGHGGNSCSDYLRDNLHNYIIKNENFPFDIEKSILTGFENCEKNFIENIALKEHEKSGSCALVCLIIDDILYCANCGDSRAILSLNSGKDIKLLNQIHRPSEENEKKRIIENGGSVYYSGNIIQRMKPGKLSVSRAFGDINVKNEEFGGKKNVLIAIPDITKISLSDNKIDFLIMGCDGIFEYLNNEECIKCAWEIINEEKSNCESIHEISGNIVDMIMKTALKRHSLDNVTSVFVGFKNFAKIIHDSNLNITSKNNTSSNSPQEKKMLLSFKRLERIINKDGKNELFNKGDSNDNNLLNQSVSPLIKLKIMK